MTDERLLSGADDVSRRTSARDRAELDALRLELSAARAELARRESFMAAVLETIEVGIVFCGPDGTDWTRNRAGRVMLGLGEDGARDLGPEGAAPLMDVLDADGRRIAVDDYPVLRALRGEDVGAVELLLGPAGGPHQEVIALNSQIVDAEGAVLGAVCALTDVTSERNANRELAEQGRKLLEAQRIGRVGSFELDHSTGRWSISQHLFDLWGLPPDGSVALSASLLHPDDRGAVLSWWAVANRVAGGHVRELRILRGDDGAERRIRASVELEVGPDGEPALLRGTTIDITELTLAEQAARDANAFLTAVLTASPDYTFIAAVPSGTLVWGSPGKHILGLSTDALAAMTSQQVHRLVHPEDLNKLRRVNASAVGMADGSVLAVRYRGLHTDGQWHWLSRRVTPFKRDATGDVVLTLGVVRDVTDQVAVEDRLTHASLHDDLTGLPNRTLLMDRLANALNRATRHDSEVTVLFCDLDGFKQVNDTAGHAAGDAVLQETARRITAAVRIGDTVARIGGDEFVMLIEPRTLRPDDGPLDPAEELAVEPAVDLSDEDRARADRVLGARIAARVAAAVREPITIDGVAHFVTASIGMTFSGDGGDLEDAGMDPESVLKRADDLMYLAKAKGKDRVQVHRQPH